MEVHHHPDLQLEEGWTRNYAGNIRERIPVAVSLLLFLKKKYGLE